MRRRADPVPFKMTSTSVGTVIYVVMLKVSSSFDVDPPAEVDDEYWENDDPDLAFKQPPGKPSKVTAFIKYMELMRLVWLTLCTIVRAFFLDT